MNLPPLLFRVLFFLLLFLTQPLSSRAGQTDIEGPPGSGAFGTAVTILPNGNIVVTDPLFDADSVLDAGAVTWWKGTVDLVGTVSVENTLAGPAAGDQVGLGTSFKGRNDSRNDGGGNSGDEK